MTDITPHHVALLRAVYDSAFYGYYTLDRGHVQSSASYLSGLTARLRARIQDGLEETADDRYLANTSVLGYQYDTDSMPLDCPRFEPAVAQLRLLQS